jgi:hypothetical protein
MKWTAGQDETLRECASQGARVCAHEIKRVHGIQRTPNAVRVHAHRIGVSLYAYEVCPGCGRTTKKLRRDGLCGACHERRLARKAREELTEVKTKINDGTNDGDLERAKREHGLARKAVSRSNTHDV